MACVIADAQEEYTGPQVVQRGFLVTGARAKDANAARSSL